MDEENKEDVKEPEGKQEEEASDSEEIASPVSEDLKDTEEKDKKLALEAEELLKDKTSPKKQVSIPYDKFTEINEQSKLFKQFAPLLAKVQQKSDKLDELLESRGDETVQDRIAHIESELLQRKRVETKSALTQALSIWPDLKERWEDVKPILAALEKTGLAYHEALERSYFAVNPEAASKEERLTAMNIANQGGRFASGGGMTKVVKQEPAGDKELEGLIEQDKEFLAKWNIDPELYRKHSFVIKKFANL